MRGWVIFLAKNTLLGHTMGSACIPIVLREIFAKCFFLSRATNGSEMVAQYLRDIHFDHCPLSTHLHNVFLVSSPKQKLQICILMEWGSHGMFQKRQD